MESSRRESNAQLAQTYFKLLTSIDWSDPVLVGGLREGLNKFLSNAHIASFPGRNKYYKTHYVSTAALQQLQDQKMSGLVFEHLVPKRRYIQEPCEEQAIAGELSIGFIQERLNRFWVLATVTAAEDSLLLRTEMPAEWDEIDVQARYSHAGMTLQPNPYFAKLTGSVDALDDATRPKAN